MTLGLPPSTNALYIKRRGGGIALSETARSYAESVKAVAARHVAEISQLPDDPEAVYEFKLTLYFDKLENPGWFEIWQKDTYVGRGKNAGKLLGKAGQRKAETRYKRIDYDNRIKFLQDQVAKALGIDDCQIFRGVSEKREGVEPRAVVTISLSSRDQFFEEK